jgi:hypothetical protein
VRFRRRRAACAIRRRPAGTGRLGAGRGGSGRRWLAPPTACGCVALAGEIRQHSHRSLQHPLHASLPTDGGFRRQLPVSDHAVHPRPWPAPAAADQRTCMSVQAAEDGLMSAAGALFACAPPLTLPAPRNPLAVPAKRDLLRNGLGAAAPGLWPAAEQPAGDPHHARFQPRHQHHLRLEPAAVHHERAAAQPVCKLQNQ